MWQPQSLPPEMQLICLINPLYTFIELIRQPLLGRIPAAHIYEIAYLITGVSVCIASYAFIRFRKIDCLLVVNKMAYIFLQNVCVSFPIYDANAKSLINKVLHRTTGGNIISKNENSICGSVEKY